MVRRNRADAISDYHMSEVERGVFLCKMRLHAAMLSIKPFKPHWEAMSALNDDMKKCLNLLRDLPADYEEPHYAPMSRD